MTTSGRKGPLKAPTMAFKATREQMIVTMSTANGISCLRRDFARLRESNCRLAGDWKKALANM